MRRLYGGVIRTNRPSWPNVARLDHGILPQLAEMMRNGIRIDVAKLEEIDAKLVSEQARIVNEIEKIIGCELPVALSVPDQVAAFFYEALEISTDGIKRTKSDSRFQVDKKAISRIRDKHAVVPLYEQWKQYATLRSNFITKLPDFADEHKCIHCRISPTRTATGRLAFSLPNLQQIPVRSEMGQEIRKAFIPSDGKVLVAVDMSQIELRVIADLSGDVNMIDAFLTREVDFHTLTAAKMFRIPVSEVDPLKHRLPAKSCSFGVSYGISAKGLLDMFIQNKSYDWTEDQCQSVIDDYFRAYPAVADFMDLQKRRARAYGCVWSAFGRVRFTPEVHSQNRHLVEKCLREAGNMPVQSTAQDLMKLCMAELQDVKRIFLDREPQMLLQVHDELVSECDPEIAEDWIELQRAVFAACCQLSVPIDSNGNQGVNWGVLK